MKEYDIESTHTDLDFYEYSNMIHAAPRIGSFTITLKRSFDC